MHRTPTKKNLAAKFLLAAEYGQAQYSHHFGADSGFVEAISFQST
jgi:hypothetical protein